MSSTFRPKPRSFVDPRFPLMAVGLALLPIAVNCSSGGAERIAAEPIDLTSAVVSLDAGDNTDSAPTTLGRDETGTTMSTSPDGPDKTDGPDTTANEAAASESRIDTGEGGEQGGSADNLPGEATELFAERGQNLSVIGVPESDGLILRAQPDPESAALATLSTTEADLEATGRARLAADAYWYEVVADGVTGWVRVRSVAMKGFADDATAEVESAAGSLPTAGTMEELGRKVAEVYTADGDLATAVQSGPAETGDTPTITFDITGLGDDGVAGLRLRITAARKGDGFAVTAVERTFYCTRGVTADGLCL